MHKPLNCSDGSTALLTPGSQGVRMASTSAHLQSTSNPTPMVLCPRRIANPASPWEKNNPGRSSSSCQLNVDKPSAARPRGPLQHESHGSCDALSVHVRHHLAIVGQRILVQRATCHLGFFRLACGRPFFSAVLRASRRSSRYLGTVAILVSYPGSNSSSGLLIGASHPVGWEANTLSSSLSRLGSVKQPGSAWWPRLYADPDIIWDSVDLAHHMESLVAAQSYHLIGSFHLPFGTALAGISSRSCLLLYR